MPGYIINYYKYFTGPSEIKGALFEHLDDRKSKDGLIYSSEHEQDKIKYSRIVFGDFDRVSVEKVYDFSRLRNIESYAQNWLGARQTLILFCLNNSETGKYEKRYERKSNLLDILAEEKECNYNFACITLITLNPKLHDAENFPTALNICAELINQQLDRVVKDKECNDILYNRNSVKWEVYGSFSSSELAIVWRANEYADILRLVDILRDVKFKIGDDSRYSPFLSFYSIMMQPNGHHSSNYINIHGYAEVQFLLQDPGDNNTGDVGTKSFHTDRAKYFADLVESFKKELTGDNVLREDTENPNDEVQIMGCIGANDMVLRLPSYMLCKPGTRVFESGGKLYYKNPDLVKYVSSTYTQLYYDSLTKGKAKDYLIEFNSPFVKPSAKPSNISTYIKKIYKKVYCPGGIREMIKDTFPSTVGLCDTLDLLYTDFINNCTNLSNTAWVFDFSAQFEAVLDYIEAQIIRYNGGHTENKWYSSALQSEELYSTIKSIFNDFNQIIYHTAHSRRTVFVIPSCHLRYMGQFDMILHAYYGLEKRFLELAYKNNRNDQSNLTPLFNIDFVPDIKTKMYKYFVIKDKIVTAHGIFSINMPLPSMTDFLYYSMVICHETFHFIAPPDRNKRNQIMGMLYFASFVANLMVYPVYRKSDEMSGKAFQMDWSFVRSLVTHLSYDLTFLMFDALRNEFMEIHSKVVANIANNNEGVPVWNDYCRGLTKTIMKYMSDKDSNNLVAETYYEIFSLNKSENEITLESVIENKLRAEAARITSVSSGIIEADIPRIKMEMMAPFDFTESNCSEGLYQFRSNIKSMLESQNVKDIFELADDLSGGYREACQDLAIIEIYGLSLEDYFVFRDRHMKDILCVNRDVQQSEFFREVFVSDYLLHKTKGTGDAKESIEYMETVVKTNYTSLMTAMAYGIKAENGKEFIDLQEKKIMSFEPHITRYRQYIDDYGRIRSLFLMLFDEISIYIRDISRELSMYLTKSYDEWKNIELDMLPEIKQTAEDKIDAVHKREQRLFEHNIKMIMDFQSQTPLQDICDAL